jgi:hypothetical protein
MAKCGHSASASRQRRRRSDQESRHRRGDEIPVFAARRFDAGETRANQAVSIVTKQMTFCGLLPTQISFQIAAPRTRDMCVLPGLDAACKAAKHDPEGFALTVTGETLLLGRRRAGSQVFRFLVLAIAATFKPKALLISRRTFVCASNCWCCSAGIRNLAYSTPIGSFLSV